MRSRVGEAARFEASQEIASEGVQSGPRAPGRAEYRYSASLGMKGTRLEHDRSDERVL